MADASGHTEKNAATMAISSLLQRLRPNQLEDLILEQRLRKEYCFYYTIDHHDLIKYCFPGGVKNGKDTFIKKENFQVNFELESDISTAYAEFFAGISKGNPVIFLDEYLEEIVDFKFLIQKHRIFIEHNNYAKIFNSYLSRLPKQEKIYRDFTMFIAIATGFLKDGISRYNAIIENPYFIINEADSPPLENLSLLKDVFVRSYQNSDETASKIEAVFDIINKEFGNEERRLSKRTDSEAIARIIAINKELLSEHTNKKMAFLYLSSTPQTRKVFRRIDTLLPEINGERFNFHRTVEQLFINRLMQDLNPDQRIERLEGARKMVVFIAGNRKNQHENKGDSNTSVDGDIKKLMAPFAQTLGELREQYVQVNFARKEQFEKIQGLHNELEKIVAGGNIAALRDMFAELEVIANENNVKEENLQLLEKLENAFQYEQLFIIAFRKAISRLLNGKAISISRGRDPISGTGQHMPIVFTYRKFDGDNIFDGIAELYLKLNSLAFNSDPHKIADAITQIKKLTTGIFDANAHHRPLHEKLLHSLYLLILPEANLLRDKTNSDLVEEFLWEIYNTLDSEDINEDEGLYADFFYIFVWVLRRNGHYDDADSITSEALTIFNDDARFYHSRFLIGASEAITNFGEIAWKPSLESLDNLLRNLYRARNLYQKLLSAKSVTIQTNLFATLINTEIYIKVIQVVISGLNKGEKLKRLTEIREYRLGELKKLMYGVYGEYPEFMYTEAFLELQESKNIETLTDRISKINFAIATLQNGIDVAQKLNEFKIDKYNNLRVRLFGEQAKLNARLESINPESDAGSA